MHNDPGFPAFVSFMPDFVFVHECKNATKRKRKSSRHTSTQTAMKLFFAEPVPPLLQWFVPFQMLSKSVY